MKKGQKGSGTRRWKSRKKRRPAQGVWFSFALQPPAPFLRHRRRRSKRDLCARCSLPAAPSNLVSLSRARIIIPAPRKRARSRGTGARSQRAACSVSAAFAV
eukprot:1883135-Rhodomonas_salina.1